MSGSFKYATSLYIYHYSYNVVSLNVYSLIIGFLMITSSFGSEENQETPSSQAEEEEVDHPSDAIAQPDRGDRRHGQHGPMFPQQQGGGLLGGILPSILGSVGGVNTGFGGYRPGPIGGVIPGIGIGGSSYRPYPPQMSHRYFNCYNRYPGIILKFRPIIFVCHSSDFSLLR